MYILHNKPVSCKQETFKTYFRQSVNSSDSTVNNINRLEQTDNGETSFMTAQTSEESETPVSKQTGSVQPEKTLEKHFEDQAVDKEFIDFVARKFLKDVLDQCEKHGVDKQGLIREIRAGVEDHYIEEITEADNKDHIELYLEKMALVGEKRIEIQPESYTGDQRPDMEEYPRKLVEHKLMGCDM